MACMKVEIFIPDSIKVDPVWRKEWVNFLQRLTNRRIVGSVRYGSGDKDKTKKFMTRMQEEVKAYGKKSGGNREQLLNIAVYCFLESMAPEHPNYHFDNTVDSVTRRSRIKEIETIPGVVWRKNHGEDYH